MEANDYQVGGSHYDAEYKHWDWALDIGLGYLDGNATKYLTRTGKKEEAALLDLEKALHYTIKMTEEAPRLLFRMNRLPRRWIVQQTEKFCAVNKIEGPARRAVLLLVTWETPPDLRETQRLLHNLIRAYKVEVAASEFTQQTKLAINPVPVEDSNKHAPRTGDSWDNGND